MEDQLPAAEAAAVHVQEAREHHVLAELAVAEAQSNATELAQAEIQLLQAMDNHATAEHAAAEAQSNATAHVLEMTQLLQITVQPAATAEL